jgi:hypothetical protein
MYLSKNLFRNKLLLYSISALLSFPFHSCAYDSSDDNYHEIERPDGNVNISIDLAGVNTSQTIYLYQNAYFYYTINTGGKKIIAQKFYLDGKELNTNPQDGGTYLSTGIADNQIHDLKLIMGLPTGTGSLAEYAGYEMYVGELNFKVKFVSSPDVNLNIRESVDENNYYKVEWDKPKDYDVECYKVYKGDYMSDNLVATINNPDQSYYVDKDYVYGYKFYTISAILKNGQQVSLTDRFTARHFDITENSFKAERISTSEMKIKWTNPNPYPCKYVLKYGYNDDIKVIEGTTETTIPVDKFPTWSENFSLYILPANADVTQYQTYPHAYGAFSDSKLNYEMTYGADLANNLLLGLSFNNLFKYNASDFSVESSIKHNLNLHSGCEVKASNKGQVAISDLSNYVHIYSDNTLSKEIFFTNTQGNDFYLDNANHLLIEQYTGFDLYNITSGNKIYTKRWTPENPTKNIIVKTRISANGKYIYALCGEYLPQKHWAELYELQSDNTLRLIQTQNEVNIKSIEFNPIKDSEAIIQYNDNKFAIVNLSTESTITIDGTFQNIDPFTGNLLFKGSEYANSQYNVYVLASDYKTLFMKIPLANINPYADTRLYNNNLIFNGYYLNLAKLTK